MTNDEIHLLLLQRPDERSGRLKHRAFLMSVIAHLLVVSLMVLGPHILPERQPPDSLDREPAKRLGFLALPRDYQELFREPTAPKLPDKDRIVQGQAPKIDPKGLHIPDSKGNTKQPEKSATPGAAKRRSSPTAPQPPDPPATAPALQKAGTLRQPKAVNRTGPGTRSTGPSALTPERSAPKSNLKNLYAGLRLPGSTTPGSQMRARISGNRGSGDFRERSSRLDFDNRQPNFSVSRPTILSDTRGVNFGPWLTAVYFRVRDNWYSVIPQVYRSGLKGVVVIIFDVRKNGTLEELEIVRSSDFSPYDRAAISSLKLSEPFPNFPTAFERDYLTLQFTYFYNIRL